MPHAVKVQVFNVTVAHTQPTQEPAGLEAHRAAKDKAGSVATVEAVIAPTLSSGFETTSQAMISTLPVVRTAGRIETDPSRRSLFAFARQVIGNVNHLLQYNRIAGVLQQLSDTQLDQRCRLRYQTPVADKDGILVH